MTMSSDPRGLPREPDRNLALELVRATEAAAMAAARYVGHGDEVQVDQAAVGAMRPALGSVGVGVIVEGEEDGAPMLFNGEQLGDGSDPEVDIVVDPVDGTTAVANALPEALAVVGLAERAPCSTPARALTWTSGQSPLRQPAPSTRPHRPPMFWLPSRVCWASRGRSSPSRSWTGPGTRVWSRRSEAPGPHGSYARDHRSVSAPTNSDRKAT